MANPVTRLKKPNISTMKNITRFSQLINQFPTNSLKKYIAYENADIHIRTFKTKI